MTFKDEAKAYLLKSGMLVYDPSESYYWGWHNYRDDLGGWVNKHKEDCHWVGSDESRIIEKTFLEFGGTECDSSQTTLLLLTDVHCSCGVVKQGTIGVQGSTGEVLHEILGIEYDTEC